MIWESEGTTVPLHSTKQIEYEGYQLIPYRGVGIGGIQDSMGVVAHRRIVYYWCSLPLFP